MKHFYRILLLFVLLFSVSSTYAQYCTPLYDTANCSANSQDYINSVSTSGGTLNITNLGSGCTTSGTGFNYTNYTGNGYSVTAQQGSSFNISITITPSWAEGLIAWADWNHDFVFDSLTERIYSGTASVAAGGTVTASVTVPTNSYVGSTRIRVRAVYGSVNFGACSRQTYGEAEDYQLNITSMVANAPVANFSVSSTTISAGTTVNFFDLSSNAPTSWFWSFPGGTPSTSTLQNPSVVYSTPGTYSVTLTASNASGSNSITATNYITVSSTGYCVSTLNPACSGDYISNVSISGTTLNSSSTCQGTTDSYTLFPTSGSTTATLTKGSTYNLAVTSSISSIISCWIDYNQNQAFESSEWVQVTTASTATVQSLVSVTIPNTALTGSTRMRIRTRSAGSANASTDACTQFFSGETEDYVINIASVNVAPTPSFVASNVTPAVGQAVNFTDLSTNAPTSWLWSFPGGTPSSSTLQNPVVTYNTAGTYSVTLTVSNAGGSNFLTATNYITVVGSQVLCTPVHPACGSIDYISNVTLTGTNLNNSSTCSGTTSAYSIFPASGSSTGTVIQGSSYNLSVTSTSTSIISVWIDFNHNGTFETTEWTQVTTAGTANVASNVGIFIPTTAVTGLTSMRIRSRATGNPNGSADACTSFGSGEAEDYQIMVASPAIAPVANFSANFTTISVGGSTNFTDLSTNNPTSWAWTFTGGTPSTSTLQNPTNIVYNTPGCYAVTLTATNASGSNSVTGTCYINVLAAGQQYCLPNPTNGTTGGDYINSVTLNTLSNLATGSQGGPSYTYYNTMTTDLYGGSAYTLIVGNGAWATDTIAAWVDFNGDGDFADAGEKLDQLSTTTANSTYNINFTVPTNITGGYKIMRVRIIDNGVALPNADPCTDYAYGETEDYIVNIVQAAAPVTSFTSDVINVAAGGTVNYFETATNSPTSFSWSFPGGSPSSSTLQNPSVIYTTPGCYAVTLTASNAYGSNTITQTCYIQVTSASTYCITNLHSVDCSGGYINTVAITGTTLNAANTGCSSVSELGYVQWNPTGAGTATVTKGQSYMMAVTTSISSIISVWIDYNQNGTFETTEWKQVSTASTANVASSTSISIPTTALTGYTRMRVRSRNAGSANASTDACTLFGSGETEDFIIQIQNASTTPPVAAFTANNTVINVGQSVTFTDLSSNSPTSWAWTFTGGTPASSTSQNPTITYNTAGTYSVSLTATNASGSNTATQTSYITVINALQYVGMGSSANVYTAIVEQSNCLTANQDLNMIMFTRRKNTGDAGNSGYVQSSYSINGGAAFDSSLTIVSSATNLSRYPSGAIFNPTGNTSSSTALSVVSGPFTLSTGSWVGNYFGSSKMNNTFNNQLFYTNTALPTGQIKSDFARYGIESNSAFVSVCGGRFLDINGTTNATSGFSGAVIHKGTYSSGTGAFTWAPKYIRHSFAHSPIDNSAMAITTPLAAWSANGTIGYLVFMGVDSLGYATGTNNRYQPIVYKTTNSGTTWSQMALTNYSNLTNINSFLTATNTGTKAAAFLTAQGWDVTVDAANNLHIASVIGSHSSNHVDSLTYYYTGTPMYVYDVYTTSTGWNALLLDTITTNEIDANTSAWQASDGSGGNGYGARLQISKSSDGNRIFYGWVDTDPMYQSTVNSNPDIHVKGYNVQTNLLTPTRNFTKNTFFGGKAFFHYISNITLKSGSTYTIPGSLVSSRGNNGSTFDAIAPVQHWYVKNMQFTDNDFTITPTQGSVVTLPNASFTPSASTICVAGTIAFTNTSTNATSYSWSFPGGNPSTSAAQSPSVMWTLAGTYTVTLTATNANGSSTSTQVITINALPTVNAGNDMVVCAGSPAQIGAASTANVTYTWTPATDLSNATISNPIATSYATTVYTVTATSAGCTATDVVVVTINANPIVNLGADVNVCNGASATLNAGNSGSTFNWTPSTGLSSANAQTVLASPTATTTYLVTVTNSSGCSATDNITVNVSSVSANAGQDVTICSGSNTTLTATGGTTYVWSPSTGLSSTTGSSVVASPAQTTTYTVTATSNGCTATDQVIVNVNSVSANAGADASICPGGSTQLLASGGTSYSWSPATGLSSASISNPIATPTTTTSYVVTVTNGSCTATDIVVVTVNANNANAGVDQNICLGASAQMNATGGTTYSWSPSTGLSSASIANPVATPSVTTTYTVTVSNNGCTNTDQVTVNVNTSAANAGNDVTVCTGNSVQLNATGGVTYSWSPTTGLSNATSSNPIASPSTTTTYLVTATSGSCVTTDFVTVTVASSLNLNAGVDQTLCSGQSLQLNATGGAQYSWSPSTGLSNSNIANPIANPSSTTTYTVTTFSGTCSSTDQITITVVPGITANAGSDITLCNGATSTLSATGGTTYSWSPATGLSNASIANPVVFPTSTTTYVVTATTAGCSDADTVVVTVGNATANAGIDVALCSGQNTTLNASGGTNYSWSPSTGLSNPNISNPIATPGSTTTYTVTVTSGICTATDNVTITVSSVSVNAGQDVQICSGASTNLNALGSGATTYTWTPTTGISNPSISNPVAAPSSTTLYTITVTDGLCSASDNINVVVNANPTAPTITNNNGTLSTGTAVGYQWLLNGNIIPGANAQQFIPIQNGSYSVVITNGNGCTATSSVYSVLTVGIEDSKLTTENVTIYPNPVSSELTLKVDFYRNELAHIEIIDMIGKSVIEIENGMVAPGFIKTVDVSSLTSGVYFVRIKTDNQNIVKKLIRE